MGYFIADWNFYLSSAIYGRTGLVRNSNNSLYSLLMYNSSPNIATMFSSTSDGQTWSIVSPTNSPTASNTNKFSISDMALDSKGILHIVMLDSGTPTVVYTTFSTDAATSNQNTWSGTVATVATLINGGYDRATIAIDSNDKPHIAYVDAPKSMGTVYYTVYYTNKISGTWKTPIEVVGVSTTNPMPNLSKIVVDKDNKVIFHTMAAYNGFLYQGSSNDASAFNSASAFYKQNLLVPQNTLLNVTATGGIYYTGYSNSYQRYFTYYLPYGSAFSSTANWTFSDERIKYDRDPQLHLFSSIGNTLFFTSPPFLNDRPICSTKYPVIGLSSVSSSDLYASGSQQNAMFSGNTNPYYNYYNKSTLIEYTYTSNDVTTSQFYAIYYGSIDTSLFNTGKQRRIFIV